MNHETWSWKEEVLSSGASTLIGYTVEATDGSIGKIDEASIDTGSSSIVVDTGFWIFGKKRVLPAGVVKQINDTDQKVFVSCSKNDVKNAPDYDPEKFDQAYRDSISSHYMP